jgi:phosphotransferase system HPr (HPr) family protein
VKKISCGVRIKNPLGLHARPAMEIVRILQHSRSTVFVTHENRTIDARSIISLLSLAAPQDAELTISVEGEDAHLTMKNLLLILTQNHSS